MWPMVTKLDILAGISQMEHKALRMKKKKLNLVESCLYKNYMYKLI